MSDRFAAMAQDELEARLAELAPALAFPPTPDLATAVGATLRSSAVSSAVPAGALLRPIPWRLRRSVPRSLLLAAALALLVVGGALAVRFGLELLSVQFGPIPSVGQSPTASAPSPSGSRPSASPGAQTQEPFGAGLGLGRPLTLEQARAAAAFDVLVPAALGPPDVAYVGGEPLRGQVALVYAPRANVPASNLLGGAGLLITQNRGQSDDALAHKLVAAGATVESLDVDGAPGVWISGQPHVFWYLGPNGAFIEDSRRVVGDTLAWERDGVLYRIEGAIPLTQALEIAQSMR